LSLVLTQHSQRRFVEEERKRHVERIEATKTARRHQEAISESRRANCLSQLAIAMAIGAVVIAGWSLYLQWADRSAAKQQLSPEAVAPALSSPATATSLPLTNAQTTNLPQSPAKP
jgi:hypothetical protein